MTSADASQNGLASVGVVIPVPNPPDGLLELVQATASAGFGRILLINDDSRPELADTFNQAARFPHVELISHQANGKGAGLRGGFTKALADPSLIGVVIAADGKQTAAEIIAVGLELAATAADEPRVILATRDLIGEPSAARHNRFARATLKLLYGRSPTDTLSGLKGLTRAAAESVLAAVGDHFDNELKVLMATLASGTPIREVPIAGGSESTPSGYRPGRDTIRNYWTLLRQFFGFISTSLLGALVDLAVYSFLIIVVFAPQSVGDVALSVVIARVISSLVNFALNRRLVFSHHGSTRRAMLRYYLLVVLLLLASASGTSLVGWMTGGHVIWAKILVDAALFLVSYLAQKRWVFRQLDNAS